MSMVATQLLLFLSCGACYRPDSKKRVSTFFLRHQEAAGRIRFINSNQAAGRTKFCRGPDLAHGLDFGHA